MLGVSIPSIHQHFPVYAMPNNERMGEAELDSMDIDTECISSEARLSIPVREGDSVENSMMVKW